MPIKNGVPEGLHTITCSFTVHDAMAAIEFYKRAFAAEAVMVMAMPGGKVGHAELRIGDSVFFLNDEFPQSHAVSPKTLGGTAGGTQLYVADCDTWYERAIAAGAESVGKPMDMFWGDRWSAVRDPFGHIWAISTRKEDLSEGEISRRQAEFMKQMQAQMQNCAEKQPA